MGGNYSDKLKAVFDLCDVDRKGFISTEHFVSLAKENFGADDHEEESIQNVVQVLDPSGAGQINFNDFCRGVQQILELKTPSTPPKTDWNPFTRGQLATWSETTIIGENDNISCGTHDNSELSTYNEYDLTTDDDQNSQPLSTVLHSDDADSAICTRSPEEQQQRQHFEDFGEGQQLEPEAEVSSINAARSPRKNLNLPLTKRYSPSIVSSHYHNGSRRSSCSDDPYDDLDGSVLHLSDKVRGLEDQLALLRDTHEKTLTEQTLLKGKNTALIERIYVLEEQVREVEMRANERIEEETTKRLNQMSKSERDSAEEVELLRKSLQHLSGDYESLKEEAPRLRLDNERLKKQTSELRARLTLTQQRLDENEATAAERVTRMEVEMSSLQQQRNIHDQLFDELTREVDDLRAFKMAHSGSGSDVTRSQRRELEAHIATLKEENSRLRGEYEDLQQQMLSAHVHEGRRLVQAGASLAQEIENLPRDELMRALREQQEQNVKLHEYVDRITLKIIEKNPSLLEI